MDEAGFGSGIDFELGDELGVYWVVKPFAVDLGECKGLDSADGVNNVAGPVIGFCRGVEMGKESEEGRGFSSCMRAGTVDVLEIGEGKTRGDVKDDVEGEDEGKDKSAEEGGGAGMEDREREREGEGEDEGIGSGSGEGG